MKSEVKTISAVPEKRLYWAIISDYNFKTALCELVDNAHDLWVKSGKKRKLDINVKIDVERQVIQIIDTAGGVHEEALKNLVSPGSSGSRPDEIQIGIFGVGTKRAVVALAEEIKLISRFGSKDSFQIDISKEWLENPSWDIPIYKVDSINEGTTIVDLSKLRTPITPEDISDIITHFSETYSFLLKDKDLSLKVNEQPIDGTDFENWAFPPNFEPRDFEMALKANGGGIVKVNIIAGLTNQKDPGKEDYGLYVYCNGRLVAKEIKDKEVGYLSGYAGIPHSDASLSRVILKLYGAAKHMPWNTSKSALNYSHPTFKALRDFLIKTITQYSTLSRRLKGQWPETVFAYKTGAVKKVNVENPNEIKKAILPDLPVGRKAHLESVLSKNRSAIEKQPWVLGIVETLVEIDAIRQKHYQTKNRMALILLDTTLEISFKEFIVHDIDLNGRSLKSIFNRKEDVISVIKEKIQIDSSTAERIIHYGGLRNKLIHERATVDVPNSDIDNYQKIINKLVKRMFSIQT